MLISTILLIFLPLFLAAPMSDTQKDEAMKYFKQYGYLPENYEQAKNKDVLLGNAIKNFESFAGLNKTGEMNDKMMDMMKQPRCGMADMYSGKSRFVKFVTASYRWLPKTIYYNIIRYSEKLPRQEIDNTVRDAFNIWTRYSNLNFVKTNGRSHIRLAFYARGHGDGDGFDGPGNVLAHALFPPGGIVHFDEEENWDINFNRQTTHFFQVAAHEIGHALGLDHSRASSAIMQPFYNRNLNYRNGLTRDDINGIRHLYGAKRLTQSTDKCSSKKITSAAFGPDNTLYVFKDGKFISDKSPGDVKNVKDVWQGIDDHSKVFVTNTKTYFFSGDKFWRFTGTRMDEGYPQKISERFPSIPNDIDAAVFINNQIYFFKGANFWVFDSTKTPRVSPKYPKLIEAQFKGLPSDLEAVVMDNENNELFAIKDGEVYFYNFTENNVYKKDKLMDYFMCEM